MTFFKTLFYQTFLHFIMSFFFLNHLITGCRLNIYTCEWLLWLNDTVRSFTASLWICSFSRCTAPIETCLLIPQTLKCQNCYVLIRSWQLREARQNTARTSSSSKTGPVSTRQSGGLELNSSSRGNSNNGRWEEEKRPSQHYHCYSGVQSR